MGPVYFTDDESSACRIGKVDARQGRPRRYDLADRGPLAAAYHAGYDDVAPPAPPLPLRSTEITVTLPVDVVLAARRALWRAGQHEAAVRVLHAYAGARTPAYQPPPFMPDAVVDGRFVEMKLAPGAVA